VKRQAFRSIMSQKNRENRLKVVEDFTVESGKTKDLVRILKALIPNRGGRTVIIAATEDPLLRRAGRNLPGLSMLAYNRLRAVDMFYSSHLILLEKAALQLNGFYSDESEAGTKAEVS